MITRNLGQDTNQCAFMRAMGLVKTSRWRHPLAHLPGDRRYVVEVLVVVKDSQPQAQCGGADEEIHEFAAPQATCGQLALHAKRGLHVRVRDLNGPL